MKCFLAVAIALCPFSSRSQPAAIDVDMARIYFDEIRELGSVDAGRLWGKAVAGPMFFVDPASRALVANEPDSAGLLQRQGAVWVGMLPAAISPANSSVQFGGRRWAMVMWPVPDNRYNRRRLLLHESFHRTQDQLGIPGANPTNAHLATADGRIWTRLEWRALTEALLREGEERQAAIRDALVFRARRRSLAPIAAEDERQLELNEGLAEYTGLVLSGIPRGALFDRAAVQLAQYEQQESFVRNFAYASGPAWALLLDAAGFSWRPRVTLATDLSSLVAQAYGVRGVAPESAERLVERYTATRMIADERRREETRIANERRLRALLVDGPTVTFPVGERFSYSFNPNGATAIAGIGTAYTTSRVTDEWGVLEVTSGGVLFKRLDDREREITGIVVAAPAAAVAPVTGDGWRLELAPGWTLRPAATAGSWVVLREP